MFFLISQILGTPTEETWEGVSLLPGYNVHRDAPYTGNKLGLTFPRLYDIPEGESMASAFLQVRDAAILNPMEHVHNCEKEEGNGPKNSILYFREKGVLIIVFMYLLEL